ncbi:SDR family oxidoreductase [soil metagenome]
MRVLVTGATGYVGGRLVSRLLEDGHEIRCLVRNEAKASRHPWSDDVQIMLGDVTDAASLDAALEGCDAAYYLVHSMGSSRHFSADEALGATTFRDAAGRAGTGRIVYLGGIVHGDGLSTHLSSRQKVGEILAEGSVSVTEMRAAVIIGSGSISFEMLRYLTEVLPVMTTPTWVRTRCQPIAIRDVLEYLVAAIHDPSHSSRVVELGGADVLSYQEMMQIYAQEAGLRRRTIVPVPVLSPRLSSLWVGLVTPLPPSVARPLIDSLRHEVIVRRPEEAARFSHQPMGYRQAVRRALERADLDEVTTRWSDAGHSPATVIPGDPDWAGGTVFEDDRVLESTASAEALYEAVARIGGEVGYYALGWAWSVRGFIDQVVGGPGLRRGRRHPTDLRPGESLDFWRVLKVEPGHLLELEAEMRLPGRGWLRFEMSESATGSTLRQTAYFAPRGLWGRLYWVAVLPFHTLIFGRMARSVAARAETS